MKTLDLGTGIERRLLYMKIKYIIIFLLGLLALTVSEYIFLTELNNQQRFYILILTSVIAIGSIVTIFACYKRLRKDM